MVDDLSLIWCVLAKLVVFYINFVDFRNVAHISEIWCARPPFPPDLMLHDYTGHYSPVTTVNDMFLIHRLLSRFPTPSPSVSRFRPCLTQYNRGKSAKTIAGILPLNYNLNHGFYVNSKCYFHPISIHIQFDPGKIDWIPFASNPKKPFILRRDRKSVMFVSLLLLLLLMMMLVVVLLLIGVFIEYRSI